MDSYGCKSPEIKASCTAQSKGLRSYVLLSFQAGPPPQWLESHQHYRCHPVCLALAQVQSYVHHNQSLATAGAGFVESSDCRGPVLHALSGAKWEVYPYLSHKDKKEKRVTPGQQGLPAEVARAGRPSEVSTGVGLGSFLGSDLDTGSDCSGQLEAESGKNQDSHSSVEQRLVWGCKETWC